MGFFVAPNLPIPEQPGEVERRPGPQTQPIRCREDQRAVSLEFINKDPTEHKWVEDTPGETGTDTCAEDLSDTVILQPLSQGSRSSGATLLRPGHRCPPVDRGRILEQRAMCVGPL